MSPKWPDLTFIQLNLSTKKTWDWHRLPWPCFLQRRRKMPPRLFQEQAWDHCQCLRMIYVCQVHNWVRLEAPVISHESVLPSPHRWECLQCLGSFSTLRHSPSQEQPPSTTSCCCASLPSWCSSSRKYASESVKQFMAKWLSIKGSSVEKHIVFVIKSHRICRWVAFLIFNRPGVARAVL